ncbi:MAG: SCO family protein [Magnetospirillum sp. WYHS-4]
MRKGGAATAFVLLLAGAAGARLLPVPPAPAFVDASFHLVDSQGRSHVRQDFLGTPSLILFGYTSCPDVCPTGLGRMAETLARLDADGNRPRALFITLDPERDGAERIGDYLAAFDSRIQGLTGSPAEVAQAAKAFRVYHAKVGGEDYRIDHTAAIFLAGADGRLLASFGPDDPPEAMATEIRRRLAS